MKETSCENKRNSANVTVITVCFNAEKEIEKTLQSVLNQTVIDFEYLIIDGSSKDNTVLILEQYRNRFQKKGINYNLYSEEDTGIYNAMNKGTKLASRDWLIFLNAGDYFVDNHVMEGINKYSFDDSDIVYGDVIEELDTPAKLRKVVNASNLENIKNGMAFCHQCAFIKKERLIEFPYDETYRIAADYNFFFGSYSRGLKFLHVNEPIAVFTLGGASSNPADFIVEHARVKYSWGSLSPKEYDEVLYRFKRKKIILAIRERIKHCIPKILFYKIQEQKYRKIGFMENVQS